MSDGIYSALTGSLAQSRQLDIISNNLANLESVGYKADRLTFSEAMVDVDILERTSQSPHTHLPLRALPDDKRHVRTGDTETALTQGAIDSTGNDLDMALNGKGYFVVDTPQGPRYTRNGSFRMGDEGEILTPEGFQVRDAAGGAIILHPGDVSVDPEGYISIDGFEVGQFEIAELDGPIRKVGRSYFAGQAQQADPASFEVRQGYLERANVNPVRTMTELIKVHRTFEALQTVIQTYRQIDSKAANELGRPTNG